MLIVPVPPRAPRERRRCDSRVSHGFHAGTGGYQDGPGSGKPGRRSDGDGARGQRHAVGRGSDGGGDGGREVIIGVEDHDSRRPESTRRVGISYIVGSLELWSGTCRPGSRPTSRSCTARTSRDTVRWCLVAGDVSPLAAWMYASEYQGRGRAWWCSRRPGWDPAGESPLEQDPIAAAGPPAADPESPFWYSQSIWPAGVTSNTRPWVPKQIRVSPLGSRWTAAAVGVVEGGGGGVRPTPCVGGGAVGAVAGERVVSRGGHRRGDFIDAGVLDGRPVVAVVEIRIVMSTGAGQAGRRSIGRCAVETAFPGRSRRNWRHCPSGTGNCRPRLTCRRCPWRPGPRSCWRR